MNTSLEQNIPINSHTRYGAISFLLLVLCFGAMLYLTYDMLVTSGHPRFSTPETIDPEKESGINYLRNMTYITGPVYLFSLIFIAVAYIKKEIHAFKYIATVFHMGILGMLLLSFIF